LKHRTRFSNDEAKFYICEIALALDFLHAPPLSIVYRDLKPENVMLSCSGHVRLVDFGFAVPLTDESDTILGGCGTAMYVAPEIAAKGMKLAHGFPVDWWAAGIMLYEMLTGVAPFGDTSNMSKFEVFNNINAGKIKWPGVIKKDAKELIKGLLRPVANERFKFSDLKESKWCAGTDFQLLLERKAVAPWIPPENETAGDVSNFLKWKDLPQAPGGGNTDYAQLPDNLFTSKVKGANGIVVCEVFDKSLVIEKPPRGATFRKSKEKKDVDGAMGTTKRSSFGGSFADTAGAATTLKKRLSKRASERKNSAADGGGESGGAGGEEKKVNSPKLANKGMGGFSKTAGAMNLAKKRLKKEGSRAKIHLK
jgi:serine/threonine protein kinase